MYVIILVLLHFYIGVMSQLVDRIYEKVIKKHFDDQMYEMVFLSGARQVGKTTIAKHILLQYEKRQYLNIDNAEVKTKLLGSYNYITEKLSIDNTLLPVQYNTYNNPTLVLDEIHKLGHGLWKNYLKGFYDEYNKKVNIIVTGSSKLDIYQKGGDSMMGRYFQYKVFPLSIRELYNYDIPKMDALINTPVTIDHDIYDTLLNFGGFPRLFLTQNKSMHNKWKASQLKQIVYDDIRDLAGKIQYFNKSKY